MLQTGERLNCESGAQITVGRTIGSGGQGEVYEGRMSDGRVVAIKWYFEQWQSADFRESITALVREKSPSSQFLWPEDILVKDGAFGYLMPLRPVGYTSLPKILSRKANIKFRELVRAASNTVAAFKALQAKGLYYCDISDANLFVDPATGAVLICDNDNVGTSRSAPRVLGTPRFMAPEIVRGEKKPSALTDSFSMSVLLFLLLMNDHPLQGAIEAGIHVLDARAMHRIFGVDPVFIFNPDDLRNRPVPGVHLNAPIFWPLYPKFIRKIFTEVFTAGLSDPGRRPAFRQWETALSAANDAIFACARCGAENFYCSEKAGATCWKCQEALPSPLRLVLDGRNVVVLEPNTMLHSHHVSKRTDVTFADPPVAEVTKHPTQGVLGLKNLTDGQWFATSSNSHESRPVLPGRSIKLTPGTRIEFGSLGAVVDA